MDHTWLDDAPAGLGKFAATWRACRRHLVSATAVAADVTAFPISTLRMTVDACTIAER